MTENSKAKQYFKSCFKKELLIKKGIIAAIACALVLVFSLSFFFWLRDKQTGTIINENGFWYINVQRNPGIAWSALSNKPGAIFAIQSVVSILMIGLFLLLCDNNWTISFMACAVFGGLFNLFQRAGVADHLVLDYFQFGFWKTFPVFNWPDMFVVIGVFGFVISYIVYTVRQEDARDEAKAEEEAKAKHQDVKPQDSTVIQA